MKTILCKALAFLNTLRDLPPLAFRLILAYGFYQTGKMKWSNIQGVAEWFGNDLHIPFPLVNAYMAATTEVVGVGLLILGLATRFISLPLMFVMIVAIATVHWKNGFSCGDNGFEIPFYFFFMLLSLVVGGAGRISVDQLIKLRAGSCGDKK